MSKQQFFVDTRAQDEQDSIAAAAFSDAKGAKNTLFVPFCVAIEGFLPRQARDKHRKTPLFEPYIYIYIYM
eukprot:COSAG06_NODE_2301_length_7120_cov_3.535251_6_plen_71_part_00